VQLYATAATGFYAFLVREQLRPDLQIEAGCEVHVESTDGRIILQGEGSFGNLDVRERHVANAIVSDDSTGKLLFSLAKSKGLICEVVYSNIEDSVYWTEVRTKWNGRRFASSGSRFFLWSSELADPRYFQQVTGSEQEQQEQLLMGASVLIILPISALFFTARLRRPGHHGVD
jgi:hypothetical protein